MSIGGEYSVFRISVSALVAEGARFGIGAETAGGIVDEARTRMLDAFDRARTEVLAAGGVDVAVTDDVMAGLRELPLVAC